MIPDKSKSWFYSINDSQLGPLTFEQLEEAANSGTFNRQTTKVWCEGLESWVLASSIEGLFSSPPPLSPDLSPVSLNDDYSLKLDNTKKFIQKNSILLAFTAPSILFELIKLFGFYAVSIPRNSANSFSNSPLSAAPNFTALFLFFAYTIPFFYYYVIVFRQWQFIAKYSNTSVFKAVGFLCIPLYNCYWFFKVFAGYHEPFNLMVKQNNLDKSFELDKSLGLTVAIMSIPNLAYNIFYDKLMGFMSISTRGSSEFLIKESLSAVHSLSGTLLTIWNLAYIVVISLYFLKVSRHINLVYAQIRANRT